MRPTVLVDVLEREVGALVARLRGFSLTRFAAAAPPFRTRGEAAFHLVGALAEAAAAAERTAQHAVPRVGDHVLADQLAVVGHDLVTALRACPDDALAAAALAEVVLHRRDIDGAPPGQQAIAVLAEALRCPPTVGEVLLAATARCPAYA